MKHLQELDTASLLRSLSRFLILVAAVVTLLLLSSIFIAKEQSKKEQQDQYNKQIDKSIHHVVRHYLSDFTHKLQRIMETTEMLSFVEKQEREALYKTLYPKYKLLKDETPALEVMQVHLADGRSFLRMHQPEYFNDRIADSRPMLQEIHTKHQLISGYETGRYADVYRIITPIWSKSGSYLGAIEIGLNPDFLLNAVQEINGFEGVYFLKENLTEMTSSENELLIDGYIAKEFQSEKGKQISAILKKENSLTKNQIIEFQDEKYLIHVVDIKDFQGHQNIKLLFFQELKITNPFLNQTQLFIYLSVISILIFSTWLIYSRIKVYQKAVTRIYLQKIKIIEENEHYLKNSQKYHKALFETIPNILIATNAESIEDVNSAMLEFFDYKSLEDFTHEHKCICEFFLEEDGCLYLEEDESSWLEYIKKHSETVHKVCMLKDSQKHYFMVYYHSLEYDNQDRGLLSLVDVTELDELRQRVEIALNGTNDGLWDWNLVSNTLYLSPPWKTMLGYEDFELEDSFESWRENVHPDDLSFAMDAIENSQKEPGLLYKNIHRMKHKDGHWVWILDRGKTIFDKSGNAVRMVGFHTDITQLKELERELLNSKSQFEMFMNNIPYVVSIVDSNKKLVYQNSSALEYGEDIHVYCREQIDTLFEKAKSQGVAEDVFEYTKGTQEYTFRALFFTILQANKELLMGRVYINISEQYHLANEIKLQNEIMIAQSRHAEMGEMISMIAHQWRQPLGVISMCVNNILVDIELESLEMQTLQEELEGISTQTTHLSKTIDDFRNFFKPDKLKELVYIKDVFTSAYNVIGKSLENNNIDIQNNFQNSTKIYVFDRELQQVFINILKNAKEALEENDVTDKKISNKIYETDESVIIEISDNGGGISDEVLEKLFEPYFSTKNEQNGTGLGLYMSKMIVEKHMFGTLSVESEQEMTSFKILLPKESSEA